MIKDFEYGECRKTFHRKEIYTDAQVLNVPILTFLFYLTFCNSVIVCFLKRFNVMEDFLLANTAPNTP